MSAMRHAMGLWNGQPGARRWRQVWSDHRLRERSPREVQRLATEARCQGLAAALAA
jgi:tRNA-dihydrouridine synthase A